jgi:hypothetical protein
VGEHLAVPRPTPVAVSPWANISRVGALRRVVLFALADTSGEHGPAHAEVFGQGDAARDEGRPSSVLFGQGDAARR